MTVVFRILVETPQGGQSLFVLALIELKFGLRQQYRVRGLGNLLVGKFQPVVAPLIASLKVCCPGGLKVVEQG